VSIASYRDLRVWKESLDLAVECCRLANKLPFSESYGLALQIRRAAVSVPANIAEGHGRRHLAEYLQHLSIARGSLLELETHLAIAERLAYGEPKRIADLLERTGNVGRMLSGLSSKLRTKKTSVVTDHR
jgi:four helix bundle protein